MKKSIIKILIALLVFLLVGCGSESTLDKEPVESNGDTQDNTVVVEDNNSVNQDSDSNEENNTTQDEQSLRSNITETVIYNSDDVIVHAKSLVYDGWSGPELLIMVENNTNKNLTVQTRNASINGFMIDPTCSANVAAGKKANDSIGFSDYELEAAGIERISEIEFSLNIFDSDSWDDYAQSDQIILKTDAVDYVQPIDDSGFVAYDKNGITIKAKKLKSSDSIWRTDLYFFIENNTEQDITVQASDVSINGFMVEPFFSSDVMKNKKAFDTIAFLESDLTENGITDIKELELSFHIFDTVSWDAIEDTEPISISFE